MDNNFNDQKEYSSSNKSIEIVANSGKRLKRGFGIIVLVLIILVSSFLGSMTTLYLLPNMSFFEGTPLYSKISSSSGVEYVGPTYFKEDEGALTVTEIAKKVGPSVVGISTKDIVSTGVFGLMQREGIGSGFIINEEGHILTNYHVVENAQIVKVIFYDGTEVDAKVINYDSENDIALIKVTDSSIAVPATAALGNSDKLLVGESVVAIGSPLAKEFLGTTTSGIVSALDRDVTVDGKTLTVLQTDAAINPGNSGGPLINSRGEVIGINTVKYNSSGTVSVEGIGFAIPINQAKQKLDELSKPILRIGIKGRVIDSEISQNLNLPEGIYVVEVEEFSNAEKAGIRSGDVLVRFGGREVKTFDDVNEIKSGHSVGDVIEVVIYRDGSNRTLNLTLDE